MKIAFLTETQFEGKWDNNFLNSRTEICWQISLNAYHFNINEFSKVKGYDCVFIIIPKGKFYLSAEGILLKNEKNPITDLLKSNFTSILKENNKKLCFIQEGSTTLFNDMSVEDQFHYYNHLQNFDIIFSHNEFDCKYYRGMFPNKKISYIPSLMFTHLLYNKVFWNPQNKVMLGGNFSRFYGGFQSYIVSEEFTGCEKWTMDSHSKRLDEHCIDDLKHLNRLNWYDWMVTLSTFKFSIHMMPIYAAGTFIINNAYFGIPCIAPIQFNTQKSCYPNIIIDGSDDVESARSYATRLNNDPQYYKEISGEAKQLSRESLHLNVKKWQEYMFNIIK